MRSARPACRSFALVATPTEKSQASRARGSCVRPVRAILLLFVCLAPLFAGCAGPSSSRALAAPDDVALAVIGAPRVVPGAEGATLVWTVEARANASGAALAIDFSVTYQRGRTAGADHADVVVPDGGAARATMKTSYVGFGDYVYTVVARDASGAVRGQAQGMWERCPC